MPAAVGNAPLPPFTSSGVAPTSSAASTPAAMQLRSYQGRALEALRREVGVQRAADAARAASAVLVMPTGSGKTTVGAAIAEGACRRGRRVLVLTHLAEIHAQWVARLLGVGIVPGIVTAERIWGAERPVQVAMVQTLIARGYAPDAEIVLVDEAHHVAADTWTRLVAWCARAQAILGLTATPERGDGRGLSDAFRALVIGAHVDELVDQGWLLPVRVISPAHPRRDLAMTPEDAYLTHCAGRRAIVFASSRAHSNDVVSVMAARGIRARHVDGDTPERERTAVLAAFRRGDLDVLSNVGLFAEGVDAPGVSGIIIARGIQSPGLWLQACGRAMRPRAGRAEPGEHAVVVDLRGSFHACGHPCLRRTITLDGGIAELTQPRGREERICAACGAADPRGKPSCSYCGTAFPVLPSPRVKAAPLREVDRAQAAEAWAKKHKHFLTLIQLGDPPDEIMCAFHRKWGHGPPRQWWSTAAASRSAPADAARVVATSCGGG